MPVTEEQLAQVIQQNLKTNFLKVEDQSDGCGAKFQVVVISSEFEGVPLLERHRKVNDAVKEHMPNIHALSLKTWTPAQWEKKKSEFGL